MPVEKDLRDAYRTVGVAVTGASGFIGRWTARLLTTCGARLYLPVRDPERMREVARAWGIRGEVFRIDLTEPGAFRRFRETVRPAITFNLATHGVDPSERDETTAAALNDRLVGEIADAMAAEETGWSGARVVHAGSALEYGPVDGPIDESLDPHPTTLYGRTKLAGTRRLQEICAREGMNAVVGRIFTAYGPGEHDVRLLPSLIRAGAGTDPIDLTAGEQQRDFTYVADVAEGLLRLGLTTEPAASVVNLATGKLSSVRAFVETAARLIGIPGRVLRFGAIPYRSEEMWHGPVRVERLSGLTGWCPVTDVDRGIRETLEFTTT